MMKIAK
jgi:integrase